MGNFILTTPLNIEPVIFGKLSIKFVISKVMKGTHAFFGALCAAGIPSGEIPIRRLAVPWEFCAIGIPAGRLMGVPNPSARTCSVQTGSYAPGMPAAQNPLPLFLSKITIIYWCH